MMCMVSCQLKKTDHLCQLQTKLMEMKWIKQTVNLSSAGRVRAALTCGECFKPSCVHAEATLSQKEKDMLCELERSYTCGMFPMSIGGQRASYMGSYFKQKEKNMTMF